MKVLDFGLAKAFQPDAGDPKLSQSPTISLTAAATQMGMVLGTAAYMAPEQAKGLTVDKRADIWAYGAVLFEMLTGRKLFDAGDLSEMLASVLVKDPDISSIGNHVPAHIRSVVRQCLVKDPKERLRDIGDVRLAFAGAFEPPLPRADGVSGVPSVSAWQRATQLALVGLAAAVVGGLTVWQWARPGPRPVTRFALHLPGDLQVVRGSGIEFATSADGRTVVFAGDQADRVQLYRHSLDRVAPEAIPGTDGAGTPFLSPDGHTVGFFADGDLRKVSLAGGAVATVIDALGQVRGAVWLPDDTIAFGTQQGLWRTAGDRRTTGVAHDGRRGETGSLASRPQDSAGRRDPLVWSLFGQCGSCQD